MTANASLVLKYGKSIQNISYTSLKKASIAENASILPLTTYKGVALSILDLASCSETKTFKASLACVTIGDCLDNNIKRIVYQSSGNTANALTAYARHHDIQSILIYPPASRYKLEPHLFDNKNHIAVECDVNESKLKELALLFSTTFQAELVPNYDHQIQANKLRAHFLMEHYHETGQWFEWHAQAISTGYGIFGFYHGLDELKNSGCFPGNITVPKALCIQQKSCKPYVDQFRSFLKKIKLPNEDIMLEPTLFRAKISSELFNTMLNIIQSSQGQFEVIAMQDYLYYKDFAQSLLANIGIQLGTKTINQKSIIIEKSGLFSLIGALKAIDHAAIQSPSSILVVFTGGTKTLEDNYRPSYRLNLENIAHHLIALGDQLNLPRRMPR